MAGKRRGPGRPARDDVRGVVLAAAEVTFVERGYQNVTVTDLTHAAGVSRATFYKHFAGRDDVLAELYRERVDQARDQVLAAVAGSRDVLEMLDRGTAAYVTALLHRGPLSVEFAKLHRANPKMQRAREDVMRSYVEALQVQQRLTGQPVVPAYLLDAFLTGIERLGQILAAESSDVRPEEAVETMMEELRAAVRSYAGLLKGRGDDDGVGRPRR